MIGSFFPQGTNSLRNLEEVSHKVCMHVWRGIWRVNKVPCPFLSVQDKQLCYDTPFLWCPTSPQRVINQNLWTLEPIFPSLKWVFSGILTQRWKTTAHWTRWILEKKINNPSTSISCSICCYKFRKWFCCHLLPQWMGLLPSSLSLWKACCFWDGPTQSLQFLGSNVPPTHGLHWAPVRPP